MLFKKILKLDSANKKLEIETVEYDSILCIFCGKKAEIVKIDNHATVRCSYCIRETELTKYQEMFDRWVGDIRKEANSAHPPISLT